MNIRQIIEQDNQEFIAEILEKRSIRRDEIRNKRRRVKSFRSITYVFQVLSLLTATYFIYHYAKDYSGFYVALVWLVGVMLLVCLEVAKRFSILETAQGYYNAKDRHKTRWTPVIVIAVCLSGLISYSGGSNFVQEENNGPEIVHNTQIDSISALIAAQEKTKAELATSKWKGTLTRAARDGINQSNAVIADLMKEQRRLQQKDEKENDGLEDEHESKFEAFGYIFGGFAGFLDALLIFLLFWAEKDETDVERYALSRGKKKQPTPAPVKQSASTAGMSDISKGEREYKAAAKNETERTVVKGFRPHAPAQERPPTHARTRTHAHNAPTRTGTRARTQERTRTHAPAREKKSEKGMKCKQCGKSHTGPKGRGGNGYSKNFCSEKCSKKYQAK